MNKHLSIPAAPDTQSLELLQQRIALESEFLANFTRTVKEVVPSIVDAVKGYFAEHPVAQPVKFASDAPMPQFVRLMNQHNYLHTSKLGMYVPEGFSGSLVAYAEHLYTCAAHASLVVSDVLTPYNQFLSSLISTDQTRLSTRDPLAFLDTIQRSREALNAQVGQHFKAGSTISRTTVGEVIQRNKDWEALLHLMPKLKDKMTSVTPQAVNKAMDDTLSLLDAVKVSATSGDLSQISAQTLRALGQHTLSVAREVEFYSITYFRVQVLDKAVEDSIKQLTAALSDD